MRMSFMTSASFNQNPSRAKKAADERPVVITDHGEARYVLVSYSDFQSHWKSPVSLLDALRDPKPGVDRDFEPERFAFDGRDVGL